MKVRFLKNFIDCKEQKERHVGEIDYITRERYEQLTKYKLVEEVKDDENNENDKEIKKPKKRVRKNEEKSYNIYE